MYGTLFAVAVYHWNASSESIGLTGRMLTGSGTSSEKNAAKRAYGSMGYGETKRAGSRDDLRHTAAALALTSRLA